MAVNPMLTSAGNSMQNGLKALDSVASEIAGMNLGAASGEEAVSTTLQDTAEAMLDLKLYQRQVQASAKVVQTADEVLGFLLDVRV